VCDPGAAASGLDLAQPVVAPGDTPRCVPLPVLRKRYTLGETTVFSVPRVTFRGELVLGVRFL